VACGANKPTASTFACDTRDARDFYERNISRAFARLRPPGAFILPRNPHSATCTTVNPQPFSFRFAKRESFRKTIILLLAGTSSFGLGGCLVATVVSGAGSVAVATVSTAGKVAGATVAAGGKVASSAFGSSADATDAGVKAAAKFSKDGMVVFFDPKRGTVWQTPWSDGLKLLAASQAARIDTSVEVLCIVRNAKAVAVDRQKAADLPVKSGDVVEIASGPHA
jgi:hypothetical protein